jgi:molecular chaperone Hsp33
LYSQTDPQKNQLIAGALILQRLPSQAILPIEEIEKQDDDWITNLSLLGTLTKNELLNSQLSNEKLLHRLFHERNLHLLELKPLVAQCSCSKERLGKVLDNFPLPERKQMAVDGKIKAICEFCNTEYTFEI